MSILIPGMEMPTSCWLCHFQDCGNCALNNYKVVDNCIIEDRRDEDCPLIHVPPHGRLIDADKLRHSHCVECTLYPDNCLGDECDWDSIFHIDHAPTIIPADPAEEGEG